MDLSLPDVVVELGRRLREARFRQGSTQALVAKAAGTSVSTISRMELGRGGRVPVAVWVAVGRAVGEPLVRPVPAHPDVYGESVTRLARRGGWRRSALTPEALWFDRPIRPDPRLARLQMPAERMVVRIVRTLTDVDHEEACLRDSLGMARATAEDGLAVEALLVVVRSSANRRRAGRTGRLSSSLWFSALRSDAVPMPSWPGRVWLARRGSHWLPVG